MNELIRQAAKIIEAAARSPLGILALMVLALSVLGVIFFREASEMVRAGIFVLMLLAVAIFGVAAVRAGSGGRGVVNEGEPGPDAAAAPAVSLRRRAAMLSAEQLKASFVRLGLFHKRWNAAAPGIAHDYRAEVLDDAVVVRGRPAGLMWQRAGGGPMTFPAAATYAAERNAERFAGFADWRVPTAEEAGSLLQREAHDGLHIHPVFERGVNFIWTVDRADDDRAWLVYFYDGVVASETTAFNAWVRVVRCL